MGNPSFLPRYSILYLSCVCFLLGCSCCAGAVAKGLNFAISFDRFVEDPTFDASLDLLGNAVISNSSVRMAPNNVSRSGAFMYKRTINFGRKPSFSTDFAFSISAQQGNGLAFFIAPGSIPKESFSDELFAVSPGVFAVEFDTCMDSESHDPNGNHIGVDVGGTMSVKTFNVSTIGLVLSSGEKLHSWIDFNGDSKFLELRLNKYGMQKPLRAFISYPIDLSGIIWQDAMFVGLSSSSGNGTQVITIYSWNFKLKHATPFLKHSEPMDPSRFVKLPKQPEVQLRKDSVPCVLVVLAFGAACGAALAFLVLIVRSAMMDRHPVAPIEYHPHDVEFGYKKVTVLGDKAAAAGKKDVA